MNTDKISYLIEAVESGTFTAAAEKLGVTQSGLNRQISSLEEELKTTLIVRSRKGVRLARGTEKIYARLKAICRQESILREELAEFHGVLCGELVIGAYYSAAVSWLPKVVKEFSLKHPYVSIKIVDGVDRSLIEKLDGGELDCAIIANPPKGYDWYPIIETEYVVWLPPDHQLKDKKDLKPSDLSDLPMGYPRAHEDTDIDNFFVVNKLKPIVKFETKGPSSAYAMVAAGLGISVNNLLQSRSLKGNVLVRSFSPRKKLELGILLPPVESASPAMLAFLALAQKHRLTLADQAGETEP